MATTALNTQSIITNSNGSNRTGTSLSTSLVIRVGPNPVGAIQSISFQEDRPIQTISELGTDGFIDSAPNQSTKITGNCKRIRYDRLRIAEAFSRGFLHAKSQRIPFDIDIFDKTNGDNENVIVTTIKNVWITSISYDYSGTDFIIADTMNFVAEDISSAIQGTNPAATGGARGFTLQTDTAGIEQSTDRGLRRGSLDVSGLISAVFSGF